MGVNRPCLRSACYNTSSTPVQPAIIASIFASADADHARGAPADKVAMALGISEKPVQAAVNSHNKYSRVSVPDPRGREPTDWDDYAPTEGFALVRKALEVLQRKGWPNSAPKIVDEIKAFKHKDCDGNLVELSHNQVVRILVEEAAYEGRYGGWRTRAREGGWHF